MSQWITSAKIFVLGAFLIASAATAGYEIYYVWPAKKCDARGAWWDWRDRQCLIPMPIWRITGRRLVTGSASAADQRLAAGTQSTSPAPAALLDRAATNSRSESRLR
jgi:hypothetical protein